ncbi:MAG: DUF4136 domain-containing protein [Actinobacteria bacterium]|nr:DUF4136 domain-containing protein [Actinomycetota bacterium]
MKFFTGNLLLILAVLAMSCSSISVKHDYDKEANFAVLKTFDWIAQPGNAFGNVDAARARNDLLDSRIKNAVNSQLAAKGYRQDSANPDFLIAYHTGLKDKVNVSSYGYGYYPRGRYYGGWGGTGNYVDVHQYEEGTLILDFIGAQDKQLIWRGAATKALESKPTPEKIEKNINKVISKILYKFPPNGK